MENKYFFNDVDDLVNHLLFKFKTLSPLKLQKSLYFLFGFYSGNYHGNEEIGVKEETYKYPTYLFDADFEAWTYGPVIRKVYHKNKEEAYLPKEYVFGNNDIDKEIENFIDDVSLMIMEKSDFALVDRSHDDDVWKKAINIGNSTVMSKEAIANEYRKIFKNT